MSDANVTVWAGMEQRIGQWSLQRTESFELAVALF